MVKNNQFRHNIDEMTNMARTSPVVDINWCNKNRVPILVHGLQLKN